MTYAENSDRTIHECSFIHWNLANSTKIFIFCGENSSIEKHGLCDRIFPKLKLRTWGNLIAKNTRKLCPMLEFITAAGFLHVSCQCYSTTAPLLPFWQRDWRYLLRSPEPSLHSEVTFSYDKDLKNNWAWSSSSWSKVIKTILLSIFGPAYNIL